MLAAIVVVVNGAFVPSSPPARMLFGHVVAPIGPVVTRIGDRVAVDGDTIVVTRGTRTCTFRIGVRTYRCDATIALAPVAPFARDAIVYVPLGAVARGLGGAATYDARSRTATVSLPIEGAVATPSPFDPAAPQVRPTALFPPTPGPPTPRPVVTGEPRPRRTAIPATPSRVPDD